MAPPWSPLVCILTLLQSRGLLTLAPLLPSSPSNTPLAKQTLVFYPWGPFPSPVPLADFSASALLSFSALRHIKCAPKISPPAPVYVLYAFGPPLLLSYAPSPHPPHQKIIVPLLSLTPHKNSPLVIHLLQKRGCQGCDLLSTWLGRSHQPPPLPPLRPRLPASLPLPPSTILPNKMSIIAKHGAPEPRMSDDSLPGIKHLSALWEGCPRTTTVVFQR
jgi:hypothetical protein